METRESVILAELLEVNKESSAQVALLVEEVKLLRQYIKDRHILLNEDGK
jgi:hypothetical protein